MAKAIKESKQIVIHEIQSGVLRFNLLSTSAMIMNRFQQKAWQELLFPSQQKNRAERAQTLKHNPLEEFRGAVYRNRDPNTPAMIHVPPGAFHGALAEAALRLPGSTKTEIKQLTKIEDVKLRQAWYGSK